MEERLKIHDTVVIDVNTTFGTICVMFSIAAILPNYHYALLAQDRILVGQQKAGGSWTLSDSIDLHSLIPIEGVYHYEELG